MPCAVSPVRLPNGLPAGARYMQRDCDGAAWNSAGWVPTPFRPLGPDDYLKASNCEPTGKTSQIFIDGEVYRSLSRLRVA
jgi:hypothetical protein